jgi:hypothetical protein
MPARCSQQGMEPLGSARHRWATREGESLGKRRIKQRVCCSDRTRIYRGALHAARQEILTMRANDEIGDDAFHQIEEELDRLDIGVASERA